MTALSNPRHERFAQELAKGKSQTEAYLCAGYDATEETARRAASQLMTKHDVRSRLAELQSAGAKRAEVTVESLLAEAEEARKAAMTSNQISAAVAAIREKGVLSGKRVERAERGEPGDFESLDADSLRDSIARDLATLGREDLAVALVGGSGEPGGKPH